MKTEWVKASEVLGTVLTVNDNSEDTWFDWDCVWGMGEQKAFWKNGNLS